MEKRIGNIIIQTPGGTAAKSSNTYKVSLPSSWIKEIGITDNDRQVELCFDGTAITISKRLGLEDFIAACQKNGHCLLLLSYYDEKTLCSKIAADYTAHTLYVEDHIPDIIHTAFGNNHAPTWEDYQLFLEDRCLPKNRAGLREYLQTLGLDEYDPLEIIKKTAGRMAEDHQWIEIEVIT